jgi:signal transduction histidine kinase
MGDNRVPLDDAAKVVVEWKEAHSIGWGGRAKVSYAYLPPGQFKLLVQTLSVEGQPTGDPIALPLHVVPPFNETPAFWIAIASLSVLAAALATRHLTRRRMQRRLDTLEREKAVEDERRRIARDLHDNLGADLTHLALLSELAHKDIQDPSKTARHFDQIFDLAQAMTRQVGQIVWSVNPANDSLKAFVPFLCSHTQNYLGAAGIASRFDLPESLPKTHLSSLQRHHLFLVVKEALHNIVKHSQASEAVLCVRLKSPHELTIEVIDNGKGISAAAKEFTGNGTANMHQRMSHIGGSMVRQSFSGKGTSIQMTLPLSEDS